MHMSRIFNDREKTTHELEIIAPSWVHSLTALSLDNERKIREAAHVAHREFVAKIGSGLAVYMKRIFTHWYLHMHDNSPAVVAAATKSIFCVHIAIKNSSKGLRLGNGFSIREAEEKGFSLLSERIFKGSHRPFEAKRRRAIAQNSKFFMSA